jgi:hypothetical protein
MIGYTQLFVWTAFVIVLTMKIVDKKLLRIFKAKNATMPLTAIRFDNYNRLINWRLKKMANRGVVCSVEPNTWYFDQQQYKIVQKERRMRVLITTYIVIGIFVIAYWVFKG